MDVLTSLPLLTALLMGLLGSVHCVGMCGGIVGMLSFSLPQTLRPRQLLPYHLAYSSGRIFSYSLAGALAGGLGALLGASAPLRHTQMALYILAGVMMLLVGLYLAGWAPMVARIERLGQPLWRRLEPLGRRFMPPRRPLHALGLGAVWGWLPCGLVYSALIMALSTASALRGGLLMLAFGLGTLPTLLAMGSVAGLLQKQLQRRWLRRLAGLLMIAFAGLFLYPVMSPWLAASPAPTRAPCDLADGPCSVRLPSGDMLSVNIPQRINPLKPFRLQVSSTAKDVVVLEAVFDMPGMDMGFNRFGMQAIAPGQWQTQAMLPICVQGRSDWLVTLTLRIAGKTQALRWRLRVENSR